MNQQQVKTHRIVLRDIDGARRNLKFPRAISVKRLEEFKQIAMRMIAHQKLGFEFAAKDLAYIAGCDQQTLSRLHLLGINLQGLKLPETLTLEQLNLKILRVATGDSARKLTNAAKHLEAFFGKNRHVESIGHDAAMEFQAYLKNTKKLAPATVARTCSYANQIWNYATKAQLLDVNPWKDKDIKKVVKTNEDRHHLISQMETELIWNAIQTEDDRLRFVLLRFLGLRAPSEINNLTWNDVDWNSETVRIHSDKTKHSNGGVRNCPITHPTVNRLLRQAFQKRHSDNAAIVPQLSHRVLTKRVVAWLGRAGVERWPQLLVNFRRTAVTDALDTFPQHVVSAYFGHCEDIIRKHYAKTKARHADAWTNANDLTERTDMS